MKRSVLVRAVAMAGVLSGALVLAGCNDDAYLPRNSRHWVALSPEIQNKMSELGLSKSSPILIRAFKKESELEVWKADNSGAYKLLHTYPICRWSGQLGPKKVEGDRQVPEGFYSITPTMMNPNSSFYLSFNVGYPNTFDRQLGRNGSHIMVHGACSSRGCFSMTDRQIADIYAMARESFSGGQQAIQMQSLPFRLNAENLAKYRADENLPFWKNLKEGADHFEVTKREVQVAACNGKYRFGAVAADAAAACSTPASDDPVSVAVRQKAQQDEVRVAELTKSGAKALKRIYKDGDQHPSFKNTVYASVGGAENVTRAGTVAQSTSRVAEVSQPEALDFGHVDVAAERARGLNRQQMIAMAQRTRIEQEAAANPPAAAPVAAATATAVGTAPVPRAAPPANARNARNQPPAQSVQATALVSQPKTAAEQPAFYQRWLGSLSGLTASASGTSEATGTPANLPTPPAAPTR
ncbi:MAG: L,D-transpeptidase family protein [Rhabdaerophilum sp.]